MSKNSKSANDIDNNSTATKPPFWKRRKFWKRSLIFALLVPVLFISIVISILYWKQEEVVQHLIEEVNQDFVGMVKIEGSHISPFETFPYICIDLEHVQIYEYKDTTDHPLMDVEEVFLGFDIFDIVSGGMEVKEIKLKKGEINLVQHVDGEFNIAKALSTAEGAEEIEDPNETFHLDLHEIILEEVDIHKLNEANNLLVDAYVYDADAIFRSKDDHIYASLESYFELNLIQDGDTTFIKHKHFDVDTELDFLKGVDVLTIQPTVLKLEGSEFNMDGDIDFLNDLDLNLNFSGRKKNFELFFAMAPEELIPVLKKYENQGDIFFEAHINGPSINGGKPAIDATFGCENAFFNNKTVNRQVDELNFVGHFTNGEARDPSTMQFTLKDFHAKPEIGDVNVDLEMTNFLDPEIELKMESIFELEFLADFLNIEGIQDMRGSIALTTNFHDIVNLDEPEHAIKKLNESYYTELKVEDLHFVASSSNLEVKDIDMYVEVEGHKATIGYFDIEAGNSDVHITGSVSDLPAILHHTDLPVDTRLKIESKYLDLFELTGSDTAKSVDEQISNLSLDLDFKSSARDITESPNLPIGEFFIEDLYADLKHYPHRLHDFHADVIIREQDLQLIDFKGMIDESDFLFSGVLTHYDKWFMEHPQGDTRIDFNLKSDLLRLEDLFSYKGENYVPEDYRHEEFDNLHVHGVADLHFNEGLQSTDLQLDKFEAKMKVHPFKFENFFGRVHYEKEHLVVEDFHGKLGKSDFKTTLHWYLGEDEAIKLRDNHFSLSSNRLDFDELFQYEVPADDAPVDHDAGFNVYELPFTDMTFDVDIKHLNYHKYLIHNIKSKFHTTPDHYIRFDEMSLDAAGGTIESKGYFNGSNPDLIYFSPEMTVHHVDLDKLLFKFDNFGQDYLVSENLHGEFSGEITGKVHMHNDLVPKIDDSEIHMDVHVIDGRLEHFAMLDIMADYFKDKNLTSVRFDTLDNHIDLTNGILTIPNMDINSSLGFMHFEGKQDMDLNFEYFLRIPWSLVTQAASSKLFGKKPDEVDPDQVDAIQYADPEKKTRFVNLKVAGNPDDYTIKLGKKKKPK